MSAVDLLLDDLLDARATAEQVGIEPAFEMVQIGLLPATPHAARRVMVTVTRDGEMIAHGSASTLEDAAVTCRRSLRSSGARGTTEEAVEGALILSLDEARARKAVSR